MKSQGFKSRRAHARSLPVRGAWVEMRFPATGYIAGFGSLPVRGAWVEIQIKPGNPAERRVAPRAGSVG